MRPRVFGLISILVFSLSIPALASASDSEEIFQYHSWLVPAAQQDKTPSSEPRSQRIWHVSFEAQPLLSTAMPTEVVAAEQRPQAFEYSDAYNTRRKIHLIASYATIPLFVGQYIAGEKLYDGNGGSTARSAHGALAGGLAALFAVNTVTGVWNLWEARKDPNGKTRRLVHGLLMLGADAGFAATAAMAPDDDEGRVSSNRSTHRNVAIASMGASAASYLYMLFTR
jgi:hypothetical protein